MENEPDDLRGMHVVIAMIGSTAILLGLTVTIVAYLVLT